ncbi:hypothetical protein CJ306_31235 (plasmid) [Bacillus cereus]|nr:hypothetical protein CJ306_31235 [Bacillus cereus]
MVGCCPFSFLCRGKGGDSYDGIFTVFATGFVESICNISKKRKRTSLRRRKQKGSSRKRK